MVGGLDVLGEVDVRDVEGVAVLVEAVRRAVGAAGRPESGDAGQVEQVADGVLVLGPGQAAERGDRPEAASLASSASVKRPIEPAEEGPRLVGASAAPALFGGISPDSTRS